jgi:ribosomal protein S18 acetylase RimI-like enzyme
MQVFDTQDGQSIDDAAQIWAEATAARDGRSAVPGLDESRPVIAALLENSTPALLLIARSAEGAALGFAAARPCVKGPEQHAAAELCYFGVRPSAWGCGVGRVVLGEVRARLREAGFAHVELSVYVDNTRAVDLYTRCGWLPFGRPLPHARTGRLEQRYRLSLTTGPLT